MIAPNGAFDPKRRVTLLLLLFAIAATAFQSAWSIRPTHGDNLYVLAWVDQATLTALLPLDAEIYPEWRPLAYFTVWIVHHLIEAPAPAIHLVVNLLIWVMCAWLVMLIVHGVTNSTWSAATAAILLLIDQRAYATLTWIVERQMSLACLLGLTATWVLIRTAAGSTRRQALVAVLLLGSALAKEYGLAFAIAAIGSGILCRRSDYTRPAAAALCTYAILRLVFAGGAFAMYCEDMGMLFATRHVCVDPLEPSSWPQMAYNSAATLFSSLLPGFFSGDGALQVRPVRLSLAAPLLLLAAIGAAARPRLGSLLLLQALATAMLSAYLFRSRNQLVTACAVAIAGGCGLAHASALLSQFGSTRLVRTAVAFALAVAALLQVVMTRSRIADEVRVAAAADPCDSTTVRERDFGGAFVSRLKVHYGLPDAHCDGADQR